MQVKPKNALWMLHSQTWRLIDFGIAARAGTDKLCCHALAVGNLGLRHNVTYCCVRVSGSGCCFQPLRIVCTMSHIVVCTCLDLVVGSNCCASCA